MGSGYTHYIKWPFHSTRLQDGYQSGDSRQHVKELGNQHSVDKNGFVGK